jgi:hypothetical protein
MITTFTIVASFMGVASGWIWYKWSKKVHIKVEELVEPETKKQMVSQAIPSVVFFSEL